MGPTSEELEVEEKLRPRSGMSDSIQRLVKLWWDVTTDEGYLTSSQSHRTSWSRLFPYCAFAYSIFYASNLFLGDVVSLWKHLFSLLMLTITFSFGSRLPTRTLLPDIVVICPCIICSQIAVDALDVPIFLVLPYLALSQGVLGFHSLFYSASMHRSLSTQLVTSQRLLDIATDGFCSVDTETSTITSASSQFMRTFGDAWMVGSRLEDFVAKRDAEMLTRHIQEGVGKNVTELSPTIATCQQKRSDVCDHACTFDARFVLFASDGKHVQLFLNVIGERRSLEVSTGHREGETKSIIAADMQATSADELRMS
eukprot:TRINITY_DN5668_c0_g6_i1.p1 TRINITY_DN5668_c0_g6~~TRINITY_DN5668_c0_g6_i1.p1  ORF type:complete len:312 (+),score=28.39 TRINITY_DN5668_c0_g6_i1:65-1000(+)